MTTTPDSRIRADFGMDGSIATDQFSTADIKLRPLRGAQPTKPIDTSTTAGKAAVMQHVASGGQMQMMTRGRGATLDDDGWSESWTPPSNYNFNWERYDYRIAPRTALQAAREFIADIRIVEASSPAGRLCSLVAEIDRSEVVTADPSNAGPGWVKIHVLTPHIKPGRYRLVRDET